MTSCSNTFEKSMGCLLTFQCFCTFNNENSFFSLYIVLSLIWSWSIVNCCFLNTWYWGVRGSFWQQEDGTFLIWLWNMDFEGGGACEGHSCNCRCHRHFLWTTNFRNISGEERRTVKELVLFLPCVRWLEARRTFPNDDFFFSPLCFCSTA